MVHRFDVFPLLKFVAGFLVEFFGLIFEPFVFAQIVKTFIVDNAVYLPGLNFLYFLDPFLLNNFYFIFAFDFAFRRFRDDL